MFSVYGKAGRVFRGSLEELRRVGPAAAVQRAGRVGPLTGHALASAAESTAHFAQQHPSPVSELSLREAASAYAQSANNAHMPSQRLPLTRVEQVMTRRVVTVSDQSSVAEAWRALAQHHVGQAPVVNAQGVLVGLFTRADLLRPDHLPGPDTHALVWKAHLAQSVTEWMWSPVPSVAPNADIRRVARVLLDTGLPGLPVVSEEGLVLAFVSRSDILQAVVADPPLDLWS
jgi:CBS domain-containing protein